MDMKFNDCFSLTRISMPAALTLRIIMSLVERFCVSSILIISNTVSGPPGSTPLGEPEVYVDILFCKSIIICPARQKMKNTVGPNELPDFQKFKVEQPDGPKTIFVTNSPNHTGNGITLRLKSHTTAVIHTSAGDMHRWELFPSRPNSVIILNSKLSPSAPIHAGALLTSLHPIRSDTLRNRHLEIPLAIPAWRDAGATYLRASSALHCPHEALVTCAHASLSKSICNQRAAGAINNNRPPG